MRSARSAPQLSLWRPLVIDGALLRAVVFEAGTNSALAGDFVRFLAEEGWLAHWLDFAGDEILPPMRKLVEQPFWLDTSDPHRMRAAVQIESVPFRVMTTACVSCGLLSRLESQLIELGGVQPAR